MADTFTPPPIPPIDEIIRRVRSRRWTPPPELPEAAPPPDLPPPPEPPPGFWAQARDIATGKVQTPPLSAKEPPADLDFYERDHEDFNKQLESGVGHLVKTAEPARRPEAIDAFLWGQHAGRYGRRVADLLREGRRHAARQITEGVDPSEAGAQGTELAKRHLENLRNSQKSGEMTRDAEETSDAYEGLIRSLTTPRGLARLAVTTGVPMLAMAATSPAGPFVMAGAGTVAGTASELFAQSYIDKRPVDVREALTGGVTNVLEIPALRAMVGGPIGRIANPLVRRAVGTAVGAGAEGLEEAAQQEAQDLVQNSRFSSGPSVAAQFAGGAIVGGAIGGVLTGPGETAAAAPEATAPIPGGPPGRPGGRPPGPLPAPTGGVAGPGPGAVPGAPPGEWQGPREPYVRPGAEEIDIGGVAGRVFGGTLDPAAIDQLISNRQVAISVLQAELNYLSFDETARRTIPPSTRAARTNLIAGRIRDLQRQQMADIAAKTSRATPAPTTELGKQTAETIDSQIQSIEFALENARKAGDERAVEALMGARQRLLDAKRRGLSGPLPPEPPGPGEAGAAPPSPPRPPMPPGAPGAAPPGAPPPGPRPGATITPVLPMEPSGAAGESPADAARRRAAGQRPGVQGLVDQGRDVAAGGTGEALPPEAGITVSGPTAGAATGTAPAAPLAAPPGAPGAQPLPPAVPPAVGPLPVTPGQPPEPQPAAEATGGRITLRLDGDTWIAHHEGPIADVVQEQFGTTALPTPWVRGADPAEIEAKIRELNPDVDVVVEGAPGSAPAPAPRPAPPAQRPPTTPGAPPDRPSPPGATETPHGGIGGTLRARGYTPEFLARITPEEAKTLFFNDVPAPKSPAESDALLQKLIEYRAPAQEPEPRRTLRVGRGAHGQVQAVFPDSTHADLFSAVGRSRKGMRGEPGRPPDWKGLASRLGVDPDRIGGVADAYRRRVQAAIELLPEGERYEAPRWDAPEETPQAFREAEAPAEAMSGDIGRGEAGIGWHVRTYDRAKKPVSESAPYPRKSEAKIALAKLQPKLQQNRREARKHEIGADEEAWAAMAPAAWDEATKGGTDANPSALGLDEQGPWIATGKSSKLYRAIRAAHTMNRPVHEGWYDVFPMLRGVPKAGERGGRATELRPKPEPAALTPPAAPPASTLQKPLAAVPLIYRSGLSAKGDLLAGLSWESPIGVDINELTGPGMVAIGRAIANRWPVRLFVDSGAFSAFKRGETQDLDGVLDRYSKLLSTIAQNNPAEEELSGILTLVVPDVVGDQAATLEAFRSFARKSDLPTYVRFVFPLQRGALSLGQMVDQTREIVRAAPGPRDYAERLLDSAIWGVPSNAAAATTEEIAALGEHLRGLAAKGERGVDRVHFLGAGSEKTLAPLIAALGPGLQVSGDSNRLRALVGRDGRTRDEALGETVGAEEGVPLRGAPPPVIDPSLAGDIEAALEGEGLPPPKTPDELRTFISDVMLIEQSPLTDAQAEQIIAQLMGDRGAREEAAEPPAPSPEAEPEDRIAGMREEYRKAYEALLERAPPEAREEFRREINEALDLRDERNAAEDDWLHFRNRDVRVVNRAVKVRAAKDRRDSAAMLFDARMDSIRVLLRGAPDAELMMRRLDQVLRNVGVVREKRERPPITNYDLVRGYLEHEGEAGAMPRTAERVTTIEEAVAFIQENAPYYSERIDDAEVLAELERIAPRIDNLTGDWVRRYFDLPGVGRGTIATALKQGPSHPAFQKLLEYRKRGMAEDQAFTEIVVDHADPMHHVALHEIADHLAEDAAYESTLPAADRGEPLLMKTFMWGVHDPATGAQATLPAAIDAIRSGRGRLFARILTEYRQAAQTAGDDVPFDVPEGGVDESDDPELQMEAPRKPYGKQDLVPGFLDAVISTPQKPVERPGKPAPNFADSELFTQEKTKAEREAEAKAKRAQLGLFESPQEPYGGRGKEAFDRWFMRSKVVDAAGRPLRVYHGTRADIKAFDFSLLGEATRHRSASLGYFFTPDPEIAANFAAENWDASVWPWRKDYSPGSNVVAAYLSLQNPFEMTTREFRRLFIRNKAGDPVWKSDFNEFDPKTWPVEAREQYDEAWRLQNYGGQISQDEFNRRKRFIIEKYGLRETAPDAAAFAADLIAKGYDGIAIRTSPSESDLLGGSEYAADSFVAFRPSQIKSAIGNRGTYSGESPNILEAPRASYGNRVFFLSAPQDPYGGRYGPPPRRPTQEQMDARRKWLDLLAGSAKIGGSRGPATTQPPAGPGAQPGGAATPGVERPDAGATGGVQPPGAGGSPRGGEPGVGGGAPPAGAPGRAGGRAPGPNRQGIFGILDPRAEFTEKSPAKLELIPERLRGNDANGQPLLAEEQAIGVAKAIEALDRGAGFLFEDGPGVGKTREILAVAHAFATGAPRGGTDARADPRFAGTTDDQLEAYWHQEVSTASLLAQENAKTIRAELDRRKAGAKKWKVLIVSKSSTMTPTRGTDGVWRVTGSYADDSAAMDIPLRFVRERAELKPGVIHIGTYHNLRDYQVDEDTLLMFDEAHQLKNAIESEVAAAGRALVKKAGRIVFATATPGDKPYHMSYLEPIGFLEGKRADVALGEMGLTVRQRDVFSRAKYKRLVDAGVPPAEAKKQAMETVSVWRSVSPRKTRRTTEELFDRLTEKGTVVKREMDMSSIDARFVTVPLGEDGREAMAQIENSNFDRKNSLMHMRWQQEPYKLAKVQDLTMAELAEGRQVVIYAARVNRSDVVERIKDPQTGDLIERIVMSSEGTLKTLREWLKAQGIPYAEIHGEADESSKSAQDRFQSGKAKVVIATIEMGGTGINLDDRTGTAPRTMILMTAPFASTDLHQAIHRIHRRTTRSASRVHMLFSDHEIDVWNARILATKIKTLHAMVSGDVQLLDPSLGQDEAMTAAVVTYPEAVRRISSVMGGTYSDATPADANPIRHARHWGKIVRSLKEMGAKITLRGGDFEVPTKEGFVISGSIVRGGTAAVGRRNVYGTAKWTHDEEAGDLVKTIAAMPGRPAGNGPPVQHVLSKLRELHPQPSQKPIVSTRQYRFVLDQLTMLGAKFGRNGKPGAFLIDTADSEKRYLGELVPPRIDLNNEFARAERRENYGGFWWHSEDGPAVAAVQAKYGKRARDLESLIGAVEQDGAEWRDLYERHQGIVRSLFGNDNDLFLRLLAVTSQASDVRGNVALAVKAYRQMRQGVPFSGYMPSVQRALVRIASGEPDWAAGPKIRPYALALTNEDVDAIAVDRHVGRFILGDRFNGRPAQIEAIRALLLEAARLLGWTGREMQAAVWALSQIEQGLTPEEVVHYDEVLLTRAAEIRRFRDYFGDVGGPGGWSGPALEALGARAESGERSSDPRFERLVVSAPGGWQATTGNLDVLSRPLLNWKKPIGVGRGVGLRAGAKLPGGARVAMSAIKEGFSKAGRVEWDGMWVGDIENAAAVYQTIRNPSVEHFALFLVMEDGTIGNSFQVTSDSPCYVSVSVPGQGSGLLRAMNMIRDTEAAGRKVRGVIGLHNHPSGDVSPSLEDLALYGHFNEQLGPKWLGGVVIDHETATIIPPRRAWGAATPYVIWRGAEASPDPYLTEGISAAAYYAADSEFKIRTEDDLKDWAGAQLAARITGTGLMAILFADTSGHLRGVVTVPRELLMMPAALRQQITTSGRLFGAGIAVAMTAESPDALGDVLIEQYMQDGLLQDHLVFGEPTSRRERLSFEANERVPRNLPWQTLLADQVADRYPPTGRAAYDRYQSALNHGIMRVLAPPDGYGRHDDARPQPRPGGGGGGAGVPPPGPPPASSENPDPDWWDRRVRYAEARVRSRMGEAAAFIDPRAFWDAFVLGVNAVLRGFRAFGRWLAEMLRSIPNIRSWGRTLWRSIRNLGGPFITERTGRPGPFDETAPPTPRPGEVRGPIRPIPTPTARDLVDGALALLRGERGDQVDRGLGRPIGVGRPGDLDININQIRDEAGIKDAMTRLMRALRERFAAIRQPKTEAEIRALALELGYTEAEYLRMAREKGALTAAEIIAGRVLRQEAGIHFQQKWAEWSAAVDVTRRLRARAAAGESVTAEEVSASELAALEATREMRAALEKFTAMMYGTAAAANEAGRALRAHGMMVESLTAEERMFRQLFRGRRVNENLMAQLIEAMRQGDMAAAGRLIRQIERPGFWRVVGEYFINSLISAPSTLGANVLGNLTHEAILRTPERGVAARLEQFGVRQGIERFLTGQAQPTERTVGEAMAALRAQAKWKFGLIESLRMGWLAVGREDVRFMTGVKGELYSPAIPGWLGKVVRTPGRVMEALDLGAKTSAMAAERAAQVWRLAVFEAQEQGPYTRERFYERVSEMDAILGRYIELEQARITNPTAFTEEFGQEGYRFLFEHRRMGRIWKTMQAAANESTFRDDTTRFTKYIMAMRGTYPWLVLVVPFIATAERILVQALRRTPAGLAKTLYNIKKGTVSGGLASDRLAQGIMGTMVSAAIYMLAKDGLITGGGPADPDERRNWMKTGKLPYAIRVGNAWISLARIEPLATTLGFAADLAEAQDQKIAGDVWDKLHYSVLNNITSKTYLEGLVSTAEAIGDPDRYGARYWKRMVGAAVPNLLAAGARAIDPTIRQSETIGETLMARVPILSTHVPARLTGTGEPAVRGETALSRFASPFRYAEEAGPERNLERIFLETGYNPQAPPKDMSIPGGMGRKIQLTPAERRIYAAYAARATAFARALTTDNDWSGLDPYAKEEILKRIYRFTHDAARRDIWGSVIWRMQQGQAAPVARAR